MADSRSNGATMKLTETVGTVLYKVERLFLPPEIAHVDLEELRELRREAAERLREAADRIQRDGEREIAASQAAQQQLPGVLSTRVNGTQHTARGMSHDHYGH